MPATIWLDLKGTMLSEKASLTRLYSEWFHDKIHRGGEHISSGWELGMEGEWHSTGVIIKGSTREIFVIMEYFCVLIVLLVTWIYTCDKTVNTNTQSM